MPCKKTVLAAAVLAASLAAETVEAADVVRKTLRARDAERSVRQIVRDLSDRALTLNAIAGVHHPRIRGKNGGQANSAVIYARISGDISGQQGDGEALQLRRDVVTFPCEQFQDLRWMCSAETLQSLIDPGAEIPEYFVLKE